MPDCLNCSEMDEGANNDTGFGEGSGSSEDLLDARIRFSLFSIYVVVLIFSLVGNLDVACAVGRSARRTVGKISMALLAFAHLCSGITSAALHLLLYLRGEPGTRDLRWSYGGQICSTYHFMMSFDQITSALALTIMCLERRLVQTVKRSGVNEGMVSVLPIIFWGVLMISAAFSAPHILSTSSYAMLAAPEYSIIVCPLASKHGIIWAVNTVNFVLFLLAPLTLMAILYIRHYLLLWTSAFSFAPHAGDYVDDNDLSDLSIPDPDDGKRNSDDANDRSRYSQTRPQSWCDSETGFTENLPVVHWKKWSSSPELGIISEVEEEETKVLEMVDLPQPRGETPGCQPQDITTEDVNAQESIVGAKTKEFCASKCSCVPADLPEYESEAARECEVFILIDLPLTDAENRYINSTRSLPRIRERIVDGNIDEFLRPNSCLNPPDQQIEEIDAAEEAEIFHKVDLRKFRQKQQQRSQDIRRGSCIPQESTDSAATDDSFPCCSKSLPPVPSVDTIEAEAAEEAEVFHTVDRAQPGKDHLRQFNNAVTGPPTPRDSIFVAKTKAQKSRRSGLRILMCTVTMFAICNLPFQMLKIWEHYFPESIFGGNVARIVVSIVLIVIHVNAAINSILYVIMTKFWWG